MGQNGRRALPTYLETEEIHKLLAASPLKHRLFFTLCARAGLRRFETCKMAHEDILWRDGEPVALHVIGKGGREALLPLAQSLRLLLRQFSHPGATGWMFPSKRRSSRTGHIHTRTANRWMVEIGLRAGLPRNKSFLHALRHSFATHLLRNGVGLMEVKDLMRHSNISVTSVYLHSNPERLQSAVDSLDEPALRAV